LPPREDLKKRNAIGDDVIAERSVMEEEDNGLYEDHKNPEAAPFQKVSKIS